jgi:hypothetical protein
VDVNLVKADGPHDRDRVYLSNGTVTRRLPVHVVHDLPHLAVESLFGITDGLWAELASGDHSEPGRATTARDTKRQKQGRIVSGTAAGAPTSEWLSSGHRRSKAVTNCVANRWGDGPDTPAGVRDRVARQGDPNIAAMTATIDDETIALAITRVRELERQWALVPPGGTLRLSWPLPACP